MEEIYVKSYQADKGDCFLVQYEEISILIDTGTNLPNRLIEDLTSMNKEGKKNTVANFNTYRYRSYWRCNRIIRPKYNNYRKYLV